LHVTKGFPKFVLASPFGLPYSRSMAQGSKYLNQRKPKTPPHVPLKYVRLAAGFSLESVSDTIHDATGRRYGKGTLSAIENGLRGASQELLEALEVAYNLPAGAISTTYAPRAQRNKAEAAA
jgi:hypothetical protein